MDLMLLASGDSKRFGSNKLLVDIGGIPMYKHMASIYDAAFSFEKKIIVSKYKEILTCMQELGYIGVYNDNSSLGKSYSISLGLGKLNKSDYNLENSGIMFGVCDQPMLTSVTVNRLIKHYLSSDRSLATLRCGRRLGNPCIFSYKWYEALSKLSGDVGGKVIIQKHLNELLYLDIENESELDDIDTYEKFITIGKL